MSRHPAVVPARPRAGRAVLALRGSLLALLVAAACGSASAAEPGADRAWTLANGLRVAVAASPGSGLAAIAVVVEAGSRDDPEGAPQIAHLVEHLVFRFRDGDADLGQRLSEAGGFANAFTGPDRTSFLSVVPSSFLAEALRLEAAALGSLPRGIRQDDLDAEKAILLREESERTRDNPWGDLAWLIDKGLFPAGHPYHPTRDLDDDALLAIDLDDVRGFWSDRYGPAGIVLAVAGDIDPDAILPEIEATFGAIEERPLPARRQAALPAEVPRRFHFVRQPSAWNWLYVSFVTPPATGAKAAALGSLDWLLLRGPPSALARELLVDEPVVVAVTSDWHGRDLAGRFTLQIAYDRSVALADVLEALRRGLARSWHERPDRDAVDSAIRRQRLATMAALEPPLALAAWLASSWGRTLGRPKDWQDLEDGWHGVTPRVVDEVLETWLRPERMSLVLVGSTPEIPRARTFQPIRESDYSWEDEDDEDDEDDGEEEEE